MSDSNIIPKWLSVGVIPLINLLLAFCVSGLFIFLSVRILLKQSLS